MKTSIHRITVLILTVLLMSGSFAFAQGGPQGPGPGKGMPDPEMQKKISQMKKIKLLEILNLDERSADKFIVKYSAYEKKTIEAFKAVEESAKALRDAINDKAKSDKVAAAVNALEEAEERNHAIQKEKNKEMKALLTEEQYAKYILFEHQFMKRLFRMMNKHRHGRGGGRGRG